MAEPKFTRCPGCRTVFRVTPEQLALRGGQVRCGHCRAVFDGTRRRFHLRRRQPRRTSRGRPRTRPATVTLRSSRALDPSRSARAGREDPHAASQPRSSLPARESRLRRRRESTAWETQRPGRTARGRRTALEAAAILLLAVLLALQAILHYRDSVAARWPATRSHCLRACASPGLRVRPLRNIAGAVDRCVRPAVRPGAQGAADPYRDAAQPRVVRARLSRTSSSR